MHAINNLATYNVHVFYSYVLTYVCIFTGTIIRTTQGNLSDDLDDSIVFTYECVQLKRAFMTPRELQCWADQLSIAFR